MMVRAALLVMVLAVPRLSHATVVVPRTLQQMTAEANAVVLGHVLSQESRWDKQKKRIDTFTQIRVSETWAGSAPPELVVRTLGGEVGTIGMKVSGTPRFAVGEEVVLFLATDDGIDSSGFRVMGLSQGKFHVDRSGADARAVPSHNGLVFAVRDGQGRLSMDAHAAQTEAVSLQTLRGRVQSVLSSPAITPAPQPRPSTPAAPTAPVVAPRTEAAKDE